MVKKNINDIKIPTFDDLFTTEEQRHENNLEKVVKISISEISDFADHPFSIVKKVNEESKYDLDMAKLIESIKENGLMMPVMVRPKKDGSGYEMISGHRRKFALQELGIQEVDAIVRDLDDNQATILMIDSNIHREDILPSEKGKAYAMRMEAMKHQGKNVDDITCAQVGYKLKPNKKSIQTLADLVGESKSQIQRYIRLTFLNEDLQKMVDGFDEFYKISFLPAVELSYLSLEEQNILCTSIRSNESTPSLAQAQDFKKQSLNGCLTKEYIDNVMKSDKPNQKSRLTFRSEEIDKFFPKGYSSKQKQDKIVELLAKWQREKKREAR